MPTKIQNEITKLFNSEKAALHRFLTKYLLDSQLIEDLVQETFIKAYEKAGDLIEPYNLKSWLYKIAENSARNCYNRTKRADNLHEEIAEESDSAPAHNYDYALQAMATLKPALRNTARLKYLYDYSIEEISADLKIPTGTVKRQLFDAREFIKKEIELMQNNETKLDKIAPLIEIIDCPNENLQVQVIGCGMNFGSVSKLGEIAICRQYIFPGGMVHNVMINEVKGIEELNGEVYTKISSIRTLDDKKIERIIAYTQRNSKENLIRYAIREVDDELCLNVFDNANEPILYQSGSTDTMFQVNVVNLKIGKKDYGKSIQIVEYDSSVGVLYEKYYNQEGRRVLNCFFSAPGTQAYNQLHKERKKIINNVEWRLNYIWVVEEVRQAE